MDCEAAAPFVRCGCRCAGVLVSLDCSLPDSSTSKALLRVILTVLAPLYIFAGAVVWFLVYGVLDYYVITP